MNAVKVKVSPKFQIVIPKEVRNELNIQPGQELLLWALDGRIHVSLPRPISELRGIAKGIRWRDDHRDHSERF
jgi:AbrB family looped-hinge helix DNA binding protein